MKTINELQQEMNRLAAQLNAPLPKYNRLVTIPTKDPKPSNGVWYQLADGKYLEHSTEERTYEHKVRVIRDENELLYTLTKQLIIRMAGDWEMNHREPGVDVRRINFAKRIELFGLINQQWQQRVSEDIQATLSNAPYRDGNN